MPLAAVRIWPRSESATRTVASPPGAGAAVVVADAVAAGGRRRDRPGRRVWWLACRSHIVHLERDQYLLAGFRSQRAGTGADGDPVLVERESSPVVRSAVRQARPLGPRDRWRGDDDTRHPTAPPNRRDRTSCGHPPPTPIVLPAAPAAQGRGSRPAGRGTPRRSAVLEFHSRRPGRPSRRDYSPRRRAARARWWARPAKATVHTARAMPRTTCGSHSKLGSGVASRMR